MGWSSTPNRIFVKSCNSPVVLQESVGNVGIGTTGPGGRLNIASADAGEKVGIWGAGLDGSTFERFSTYVDSTYNVLFEAPKPGNLPANRYDYWFSHRGDGTASPRMVIKGNGNVGIGTTSPGAPLHVRSGAFFDSVGTGALSTQITLKRDGQPQLSYGAYPWEWSSSFMLQSNVNNRFLWMNAGADAGTINARIRAGATGLDIYTGGALADNGNLGFSQSAAGNVGIGTTNPTTKLEVNGKIKSRNLNGLVATAATYTWASLSATGDAACLAGYHIAVAMEALVRCYLDSASCRSLPAGDYWVSGNHDVGSCSTNLMSHSGTDCWGGENTTVDNVPTTMAGYLLRPSNRDPLEG